MKFQRKDGPSPVSRPRPPQSDETIAAVAPDASWQEPWVQMKYFTYAPAVYPRMLAATSPNIKPGALVTVYDRNGSRFGAGFYNAKARVPLRVRISTRGRLLALRRGRA